MRDGQPLVAVDGPGTNRRGHRTARGDVHLLLRGPWSSGSRHGGLAHRGLTEADSHLSRMRQLQRGRSHSCLWSWTQAESSISSCPARPRRGHVVRAVSTDERRSVATRFSRAGLESTLPCGTGVATPDGALVDINGEPATLVVARDGQAAQIVFYGGAWCPYCNPALQTYEREIVPTSSVTRGAAVHRHQSATTRPLTGHAGGDVRRASSDQDNTVARRTVNKLAGLGCGRRRRHGVTGAARASAAGRGAQVRRRR